MRILRRAVGRKEVVIGLLVFVLAGGWFGWRSLAQSSGPDPTETLQIQGVSSPTLSYARSLLDAGQYAQLIEQADSLGAAARHPAILKYTALAQMLAGNSAAALQTAESVLSAAAGGPDAAMASGMKALLLLGPDGLHPSEARQAAEYALQQAGQDGEALLVAKVAYAAALRSQLDQPGQVANVQDLAGLQQTLSPLYVQATEPQAAWRKHFWRRGLATLADAGILAGEAGEPAGEGEALSLMRRCCPQDTWACHFAIPQKALAAAQAGAPDDHARVGMYTAAGWLYTEAGDRIHCDALLQRAIRLYGQLLEDYDAWSGQQVMTATPQGKIKDVGNEFYEYRDRQKRLVRYSADWWGIRVLEGSVDLATALQACDVKLFRAMVRLRTDRQTDPIVILQQEHTPEFDYFTAGQWFQVNSYPPQADWEHQRGELIQRIGQEECQAIDSIGNAKQLVAQNRPGEALAVLNQTLQAEPTLAETGVTLRCEVASILMGQKRYEEALGVLDAADGILQAGDERLSSSGVGFLRGRIGTYRVDCALGTNNQPLAIRLAEELVADTDISLTQRARTLQHLVEIHAKTSNRTGALNAYQRLLNLPASDQWKTFLKPLRQAARSCLIQKGWCEDLPAGED